MNHRPDSAERSTVGSRAADTRPLLLLIFVVALGLRVAAVLRLGVPDIEQYIDYGKIARNIAEGRGHVFDFFGLRPDQLIFSFCPPLFSALIAALMRCFSNPGRALGLVQAALSSVTPLAIYGLTAKLARDRRAGLLAAAAVAVYPVFVLMATYPVPTSLNSMLLSLGLVATMALGERVSLPRAAVAGVLFGIGLLTRPFWLCLLPLLILWLWLNAEPGTRLARPAVTLAACALLVAAPWIARNWIVEGRFVFVATYGGMEFWSCNNTFTTGTGQEVYADRMAEFTGVPRDPGSREIVLPRPFPLPPEVRTRLASLDEVDLERALYRAGLAFIREHPDRWLDLLAAKLRGWWWLRENIGTGYDPIWLRYYRILYGGVLALALPGLVLSLREWRRWMLLYLTLGYYTLAFVAYCVHTRYRWEIEPYLLVFAALTVARLLPPGAAPAADAGR